MTHALRFLSPLLLVAFVLAGCADTSEEEDYSDRMAEQHQNDTTVATAVVREPIVPVEAQPVVYMDGAGEQVTGYYAEPSRPDSIAEARGLDPSQPLPALIVVHEWWGLNENIEAMTRRLAGEGYRALAVDLYNGEVAESPDQARGLMDLAMEDGDEAIANMQAAYAYLTQDAPDTNVGVIGWCFGGSMALQTALALPQDLDAAVIYYGNPVTDADVLRPLEMPVLGIYGGQDQSIPVENVRTFEQTMNEVGNDIEVAVYDSAGHAFANPTGNNYVESAAEDAWNRTTQFLLEHLYPEGGDQSLGTDLE